MRIFKNRPFHKWSEKRGVRDSDIVSAVIEIEDGLIDAFLVGCIYKKRIRLGNKGKRSGARTIIAYQQGDQIFFLHGYAKNAKDDITIGETQVFKELGDFYFNLTEDEIDLAIITKKLYEVCYEYQ